MSQSQKRKRQKKNNFNWGKSKRLKINDKRKDIDDFYKAVYLGELEPVKTLLNKYSIEFFEILDNRPLSPLFIACRNGHFDVVKYLVLKGANIHHQNFYNTCLSEACYSHNINIMRFFIRSHKIKYSQKIFLSCIMNTLDSSKSHNQKTTIDVINLFLRLDNFLTILSNETKLKCLKKSIKENNINVTKLFIWKWFPRDTHILKDIEKYYKTRLVIRPGCHDQAVILRDIIYEMQNHEKIYTFLKDNKNKVLPGICNDVVYIINNYIW